MVQKCELDWHPRGGVLEKGVDALGVCRNDGAHAVVGVSPIGLPQAMKAKSASGAVGVEGNVPKEFAEPAGGDAAIEFHLPEPVLGVHKSLGEE